MKRLYKKLFLALPWLLVVGLVVLRAVDPAFVELIRYKGFDAYQKSWPQENKNLPVYVVDIDDKSLAEYGQWPWPRTRIADVVTTLFDHYGVAGVAFDMVFSEADRTSPENLIALKEDPELQRFFTEYPAHDQTFANVVGAYSVVLGQMFTTAQSSESGASEKASLKRVRYLERQEKSGVVNEAPRAVFPEMPSAIRNLPVLESSAHSVGHFSILQDVDSVVRKVPTIIQHQGAKYPTLSLELLRFLQGERQPIHLNFDSNGVLESLRAGQFSVPVDEYGYLWPKFRKMDRSKYFSVSNVLNHHLPANRLKDAFVFVGTSAPGLFDLRSTPLDPIVPGVEVHVQMLESMLTGSALQRPFSADAVEQIFTVLALVLLLLVMHFSGALASFVALVVLVVAVAGTSVWLFVSQSVLIDATYPVATLLLVYVVMVAQKYMNEEYKRRNIRNAFSHYLSPDLVRMLGQDEVALSLGGQQKEMTIMFTDIRGFTSISEKLTPQGLTHLLNRYLTPMTEIVQTHQGTIDKYIGDAVMAFWNAPLDIAEHEKKACAAALHMLQKLKELNAAFVAEGLPALDIGIGIHADTVSVGNMGSDQRFDYTVIGDGVNLSSRLEGLCKQYGVPIIVSGDIVKAVGGFCFAPLDKVAVKGKEDPVTIYELFEQCGMDDAKKLTKAFAAYQNADFDEALRQYATIKNNEVLRSLYLERIRNLHEKGVDDTWDGVYRWSTK